MRIWGYCDNCETTRKVQFDTAALKQSGVWIDIVCKECGRIVATIAAGGVGYCTQCETRREVHCDLEALKQPGDWIDIVCQTCYWIVATITAGDDAGNPPPNRPAMLPKRPSKPFLVN